MPFRTTEGLISTIGATVGTVFAANNQRRYMKITNTHASQVLTVRFGADATAGLLGFPIAAAGSLEFGLNNNGVVPKESVTIIGSGAATTFFAIEGSSVLPGVS